jgi:hypothetical protein
MCEITTAAVTWLGITRVVLVTSLKGLPGALGSGLAAATDRALCEGFSHVYF